MKYIHEAIKRLQPGIPILALHGGMPQLRRVEVYNQFVVKQRACLFATDIAARGLGKFLLCKNITTKKLILKRPKNVVTADGVFDNSL